MTWNDFSNWKVVDGTEEVWGEAQSAQIRSVSRQGNGTLAVGPHYREPSGAIIPLEESSASVVAASSTQHVDSPMAN
jgi:hypothetical protein